MASSLSLRNESARFEALHCSSRSLEAGYNATSAAAAPSDVPLALLLPSSNCKALATSASPA
eukprot:3072991-Rhodomonas_salina.1